MTPGLAMPADEPRRDAPAVAIVVMGVAGSGKTVVGEALAARMGLPFRDADEFHPPENVARMSAGVALTDEDRWPWLDAIGEALCRAPGGIVVACSALRRVYRDRLRQAAARPVTFLYLSGSRRTIGRRIGGRRGHFMPPSLLDSQFATLEPPGPDERSLEVSVEPPLDEVVDAALAAVRAGAGR
jgi:gluconokinase